MPITKDDVLSLLPDKNDYRPGLQLKKDLGLELFQNVVIQKAINFPIPLYVVTYNSRYPERAIFYSKVKAIKTSLITKLKQYGVANKFKELRLTPPIDLNYFNSRLRTNSMIFCRDMCGEQFRDDKMFQRINESLIEVKKDTRNYCIFTGKILEGIIRPNKYTNEISAIVKRNSNLLSQNDNENNIIFLLNSLLYNKYKIHFIYDENSNRNLPISIAAYNYKNNDIEVGITDTLLNNTKDNGILKQLFEQIELIIGHEIIHRLQFGQNKIKKLMNKYNVENIDDLNQVRKYLSDKDEIMAYAWQIVEFFKVHDYSKEKIKTLLQSNHLDNEKYQYEPLYYYHKVFTINDTPLKLLYKYMYSYLDIEG